MEKCNCPTKLGLAHCQRPVVVYRPIAPIDGVPIAVCGAGHWRMLTPLEYEEVFTNAMEGVYS